MASSLNKATLIGNLGRDPEIRQTNDGKEIVSFSIATSETWKDRVTGEKKEKTEWHRVVVFNESLVGVIKNYAKKGMKVYLQGSIHTRKWLDNSGQEKYTTEIILQNFNSQFILLDSKGSGSNNSEALPPKNSSNNFDHSDLDDEIPF
ncbi:single-stranded DNA-binding protein [Candidatus Tisiphia endosymbiont of Beris chalybata]|uniref:single-stranded DNA-binding protein n=1 Tax=Candidatus Tisiphia endosymbiont of Beris chalybata TaxID=3066262 RepID=UPI00312C9F54